MSTIILSFKDLCIFSNVCVFLQNCFLFVLFSVFLSCLAANTFPWMNPNIQLLCFCASEDNKILTPFDAITSLWFLSYTGLQYSLTIFTLWRGSCELPFPSPWTPVCAHSETWTMSLLWATLNLFSLSRIFSHSENVLLFPNLPSKIMIEGHEFLHCCSFPVVSFSFTVDSEKALSFFLYIAYLFYLHSCSHPSCSISPWFLLIPGSSVSSDSLAPLMHPLYQFSRTGEWTTPNLSLLPKVTAYLFIYFLKGTQFFVDHPFSNPCFPPSPLQSSGFQQGH